LETKLRERGQGLVEYALIFALVVLVVVVLLYIFGEQLGQVYSNIIQNI
jgi:pilus assembly protein Flp/PilA